MLREPARPSIQLTPAEREALVAVAGHMIPASAEYGVPGADDPAIIDDIASSLDRDGGTVQTALAILLRMTEGKPQDLVAPLGAGIIARFRAEHRDLGGVLEMTVARSYYADDRVLRSLALETRPPFPKGYDLERGDWSMLDPVRARGRIYKEDRAEGGAA